MLHKYKIKSYVLIAGLAAVFFLPITADADRAADRAMKEDGRGLKSTRGNNSAAESLEWQDGHPISDSKNQAAPGSAPAMQEHNRNQAAPGSVPAGHMNQAAPGSAAVDHHQIDRSVKGK